MGACLLVQLSPSVFSAAMFIVSHHLSFNLLQFDSYPTKRCAERAAAACQPPLLSGVPPQRPLTHPCTAQCISRRNMSARRWLEALLPP